MNRIHVMSRRKFFSLLLCAALAVTVCGPMQAFAVKAESGLSPKALTDWFTNPSAADEYTLNSAADFQDFASRVNEGNSFSGKTVRLGISGTDVILPPAPPIGSETRPFAGTFDGGNKNLIVQISTDRKKYIGLFGRTATGSAITNIGNVSGNLTVAEPDPSGSQIRYAGAIAGYASGDIVNCHSSMDIQISSNLEIGANQGIIRNIGGLAGYIAGDMTRCSNSGDISIASPSDISENVRFLVGDIGGLAGAQGDVTDVMKLPVTADCTNSGNLLFDISGAGGKDRFGEPLYSVSFAAGGIVGQASGIIRNCTNSGLVKTSKDVMSGGKIGPEAGRGADRTGGIVGNLRGNTFETVNAERVGNTSDKDPGFLYFKSHGGVRQHENHLQNSALPDSWPATAGIYDCVNTADVTGLAAVGGIVGNAGTFTEIEGCRTGAVDIKGCRWNKPFTGGIGGTVQGDIRYCYSRANIHSVTGGGYFCAGVAGGLWSTNTPQTPDGEVIPINQMTGCYVTGAIYTSDKGFRTGILAGENDSYIHDNVYSMTSVDGKVVDSDRGTTVNNAKLSAADIKKSKGIGLLNAFAAGSGGWKVFYVQDGLSGTNVNGGFPVLSRDTAGGFPSAAAGPGKTNLDTWIAASTSRIPVVSRGAFYSTTMDPVPLIQVSGLVQNADYFVIPQANTKKATPSASSGTVYSPTICGMGPYYGQYSGAAPSYPILKASISDCTIVAASGTFNWVNQAPGWVRVIDAGGSEVSPDEYTWERLYDPSKGTTPTEIPPKSGLYHWYDYTYSHGDTYKFDIKVTARPSSMFYENSTVQAAFRILPKSLARMGEADITASAVQYDQVIWEGMAWDFQKALDDTSGHYVRIPYAAKPITPTVRNITYLNRQLRLAPSDWYERPYDFDYIYVYGNPNPEESHQTSTESIEVTPADKPACMTVRFISSSSFRNYIDIFFSVVQADMSDVEAAMPGEQLWTGAPLKPSPKLTLHGAPLKEGYDYTLSYQDNTAPGKATITATGINNMKGVLSLAFTIRDGSSAAPTDVKGVSVAPIKNQVWTGKPLKPALQLKWNNVPLKLNTDFTLLYEGNTLPGKARVTVRGKGRFTGVRTLYFTISPAKAKIRTLTPGKKSLTVRYTKPATSQKATGLQLRYRVKGKSKWTTKIASVKKTSYVVRHLSKGKKYQVQMRIVRKISSGYAKGTYYGTWTAIKLSKAVK